MFVFGSRILCDSVICWLVSVTTVRARSRCNQDDWINQCINGWFSAVVVVL